MNPFRQRHNVVAKSDSIRLFLHAPWPQNDLFSSSKKLETNCSNYVCFPEIMQWVKPRGEKINAFRGRQDGLPLKLT